MDSVLKSLYTQSGFYENAQYNFPFVFVMCTVNLKVTEAILKLF